MLVDAACRRPLIALEPACDTLFHMSGNLPGYADKAWAASRREAAAKVITSLIQRDHDARMQLIITGGIVKVLTLLESKVRLDYAACSAEVTYVARLNAVKNCDRGHSIQCLCLPPQGPGHSRVQYCMAAMLATLVLDDGAMEVIKQRGEGHLVFEATLKLLSYVMNALKFALAVGGLQILSEGMTEADVKNAMQKFRGVASEASEAPSSSSQPLAQTAARRITKQELTGSISTGAAAARRLSADAQQTAALLAEASTVSRASAADTAKSLPSQQQSFVEDDNEQPEPLDVEKAVALLEACAQAMWGSAHYSLCEPLHITQVCVNSSRATCQ